MNRILFIALFFALCGGAAAQQPAGSMSVKALGRALTPQPQLGATRSMRNLKVELAKVDLVVNFDFDSATLQESSKPQLNRLAEAMRLEGLRTLRFRVEGHTDRKGGEHYNQVLSEKRARAVTAFLSQKGVGPSRLAPVGKGFSDLLNTSDPESAENRRVRIVTLND